MSQTVLPVGIVNSSFQHEDLERQSISIIHHHPIPDNDIDPLDDGSAKEYVDSHAPTSTVERSPGSGGLCGNYGSNGDLNGQGSSPCAQRSKEQPLPCSVNDTACALTRGQTAAGDDGREAGLFERLTLRLRTITLNFTPSWFSVNMGTGITSILLHQLPYQFEGLQTIANVIFGLNVALFVIFLSITLARYAIWPTMIPTALFHPYQSLFVGTFPMALSTLVAMSALSCAPHWGPHFVTFTWALWWIDVALALVICIGLPFVQFTRHEQKFENITGLWFLPVVSTIVVAATGGVVADVLESASQVRLTLIVSWILWGTGFPLALFLMALYYGRLAIYKIPPAAMIVSSFLPLGPCGQGAFRIMKFSDSLLSLVKRSDEALIAGQTPSEALAFAQAIYAGSLPIAFVIWGLGLVWLVLAVAFLVDLASVQRLHFNLGWWGFTFPLGVFANATIQFYKELKSPAFRVLATVLALIEVALWLYILVQTVLGAYSGKLFFSPCLAEMGGAPPKYVGSGRKYDYEPRRGSASSGSPRRSDGSSQRGVSADSGSPRASLARYYNRAFVVGLPRKISRSLSPRKQQSRGRSQRV